MLHRTVVRRLSLTIAVLSAFAIHAQAGYVIPSIEWGAGTGSVSDNVYNYSGSTTCNLTPSQSTCTKSIASNQPPGFLNSPNGTASGTISASVDASGAHLYAEAGVSGQADATVTGYASFYDTVYNPTSTAKQVQFTFHLDATMFTRSSAVNLLQLDFAGGTLFQQQMGYGGAGTYNYVNQDFTTPLLTVAANSLRNWNIVLSTTVVADSQANAQYLAGLPTGFTDAGNTLSFTGIGVFDAQGNAINASGLTSYAGFDYTTSSSAASVAAPEPGCSGLMLCGFSCVWLSRKRLQVRN